MVDLKKVKLEEMDSRKILAIMAGLGVVLMLVVSFLPIFDYRQPSWCGGCEGEREVEYMNFWEFVRRG